MVDVLVVDIRRSSRMVTRKNQGYLCFSWRPSKAKLGGIVMLFTPNPPSHPVEITAVMKNISKRNLYSDIAPTRDYVLSICLLREVVVLVQ